LIISGPSEESTDKYYKVNRIIPKLVRGEEIEGKEPGEKYTTGDYTIDEKHRAVGLTEEGGRNFAVPMGLNPVVIHARMDLLEQAGYSTFPETWEKFIEASLKINPRNVTVSTDLAVCYYNTNQTDKALTQIDHSLSVDPRHAKTLLNQGIIRAFGKSDLKGATQSWQQVVDKRSDMVVAAEAMIQRFLGIEHGVSPS
jgi:preprotein translocase subunit SecA